MDEKEIVYLILQDKYLKMLGYENYSEDQMIAENLDVFPIDWFLIDFDKRIKLISEAIKKGKKLNEFADLEHDIISLSSKKQ